MHLVDVERVARPGRAAALPGAVAKGIGVEVPHDGAVVRAQLHAETVGVAVVGGRAVLRPDAVFIRRAGARAGQRQLVKIAVVDALHRVFARVGQHADAPRAGREHAEHRAAGYGVRAEILVRVKALAGIKRIEIHKAPPV